MAETDKSDKNSLISYKAPTLTKDQLFKLRCVKGLTVREIAKQVGLSRSTVHHHLTQLNIPSQAALQAYKDTRADRFAAIQAEILNSIGLDDIKKASLVQRTTAAAQLYDKERLERGESTGNISVIAAYHDLTDKISRIRAELGDDNINSDADI